MSDQNPGRVTQLLRDWQHGDSAAFAELMPLVKGELRRQAMLCLKNERPGHTLAVSDLIQDAYVRLVKNRDDWRSRTYFFAATVTTMRRILVDYARRQAAVKRGVAPQRIDLDGVVLVSDERLTTILAVHEALDGLAALSPRRAKVVELKFFGGLTDVEIASLEGISVETVQRDWKAAKGWLRRMMHPSP